MQPVCGRSSHTFSPTLFISLFILLSLSLFILLSLSLFFLFSFSFSAALGIPRLSLALRHSGWHSTIHQWISRFYILSCCVYICCPVVLVALYVPVKKRVASSTCNNGTVAVWFVVICLPTVSWHFVTCCHPWAVKCYHSWRNDIIFPTLVLYFWSEPYAV